MSYLEFFDLAMEPFSNVAVGKFYYNSPRQSKALAKLTYMVDSMKGLSVVVGNIGAGKTTLARRFLDSLPEDRYEAALIVMVHSSITTDWLLRKIAQQMGIDNISTDKIGLLWQLYERLVSIYESGKKAVVLVDEAQMLQTREIMEEFRGLLNMEVQDRKLISFVFFGLPEIDQNLKLDEPLAQRVAMRVSLDAMDINETEDYIRHRLTMAGGKNIPFGERALALIHLYSKGTPRLINTICDNALLEAFLRKKNVVGEGLLRDVLEDLGFKVEGPYVKPEERTEEEVEIVSDANEVDLLLDMLEAN